MYLFQSIGAEAELISLEERRDYSALNAIRLLCSDDSEAISSEGVRGKWTEFMRCQGKRDYLHGVRLKSEPWKGWGKYSIYVIPNTYYVCVTIDTFQQRTMLVPPILKPFANQEQNCRTQV